MHTDRVPLPHAAQAPAIPASAMAARTLAWAAADAASRLAAETSEWARGLGEEADDVAEVIHAATRARAAAREAERANQADAAWAAARSAWAAARSAEEASARVNAAMVEGLLRCLDRA